MNPRDVVITGIGLVSSLGVGAGDHWQALSTAAPPTLETERFAPNVVHPLPAIDWNLQIPKRGDQRQMETWQRLGVYAAGLALDDAGLKSDAEACATMDLFVAAGGGERDESVDEAILDVSGTAPDFEVALNEKLTNDLRPTLFLAQLSNLLAGNISIVHKVTGSSRTFMGETGAGVSALQTAAARLRSGQSTHALVGGAFQAEHPDMMLGYELGGLMHHGPWQPVWSRTGPDGGIITGSCGAFLVIETREHAERGGRKAYATIERVVADNARRDDGYGAALASLLAPLVAPGTADLAISGACGIADVTAVERAALGDLPVRGISSLTGWVKEAQLPLAVAVAALSLSNGRAPAPLTPDEPVFDGSPRRILATGVDPCRGEGAVLLGTA